MGQRKILGLASTFSRNLLQRFNNSIRHYGTVSIPPVFVHKNTRVICQGFTGWIGRYHIREAIELGTEMVGVVASKKRVTKHMGLPIFKTLEEAKAETKANASVIFGSSPRFAASAVLEAIEAELDLVVCITKGIPQHEMVNQTTEVGLGQSTCVGIGVDPSIGTNFVDSLKR